MARRYELTDEGLGPAISAMMQIAPRLPCSPIATQGRSNIDRAGAVESASRLLILAQVLVHRSLALPRIPRHLPQPPFNPLRQQVPYR